MLNLICTENPPQKKNSEKNVISHFACILKTKHLFFYFMYFITFIFYIYKKIAQVEKTRVFTTFTEK